MHLEKDDLRFTRRMLELNNNKTLGTGLHVTRTLRCRADAARRMKAYFKGSLDKHNGKTIIKEDTQPENFEWTPCRYSNRGWKFQKVGTVQRHLNHFNKVNFTGTGGSKQFIIEEYNL